jgi:signal peptide peptidase SppA
MSLMQLMTGCWALPEPQLREIQAIYATHLRGEKIDVPAIEARLGHPLAAEQKDYSVLSGGVALLEASGVCAPKANLMMQISGGISTQILAAQITAAAADPVVRSIVLAIDSPGGNVLGVHEAAEAILAASKVKPLVAHTSEQLTSAGYYMGAAANAVFVSGPLVQVGSIGVLVARSYDPTLTKGEDIITAGKYKALGNSKEPLSAESRAIVQADVDYAYSIFVDSVARYRGTTSALVLEHMADGRVFRGQQAVDAGLVDGVSTLSALLDAMATDPAKFATRRSARFSAKAAGSPQSKGAGAALEDDLPVHASLGNQMTDLTRESLQKDHPQLLASLQAEFSAAGAQAERDRIAGVRAQVVPGHEALVETLATDGKTTPEQAAMAVNAAVRAAHAAAATAHMKDAPAAVLPSAAPEKSGTKDDVGAVEQAKAYAAEHGVTFLAAIKALKLR